MLTYKRKEELSRAEIDGNIFGLFQLFFFLTVGYIALSWLFNLWKHYRQLKNDKTEAELALLKSKIDPHFFFNTLNNLYGLAVEKSDKTPEIILKLSDIMRYTIYEGENDTVAIKDEVSYLEQYIEIHKIRYQKKVSITFEKNISNEELQVSPLLLIMLLENAFKHGIESLIDNAYINLKLSSNDKELNFSIENNYDNSNLKEKGIGLENFKKRLQLLYPKKHILLFNSESNVFFAQLIIKLK
ncbi:sensor histidine kinase [Flavobacteriaceae bacterium AU392]|nr:sensor histidine kinase [Flavobacteriaceae bacterium]RKM83583.1 sensor histidine kinase [Flavobacteriaceae bacterium AU392]